MLPVRGTVRRLYKHIPSVYILSGGECCQDETRTVDISSSAVTGYKMITSLFFFNPRFFGLALSQPQVGEFFRRTLDEGGRQRLTDNIAGALVRAGILTSVVLSSTTCLLNYSACGKYFLHLSHKQTLVAVNVMLYQPHWSQGNRVISGSCVVF